MRLEQRQQGIAVVDQEQIAAVMRQENAWQNSKVSIKAISELLNFFDGGINDDYVNWEKQLKLLRLAHHLPDEHVKILISMKLRGKATL